MKVLGVIPARFASTRFPGKPLVEIGGKSMIQRVYEQVLSCKMVEKVIVATDDERIFQHVLGFGGMVEMTATHHPSGTDRCAEIANKYKEFDVIVNIQGDEPFINPAQIEKVIDLFIINKKLNISTLAKKIENKEAIFNPNIVKVVFDQNAKALYFSRNPIPFIRDMDETDWLKAENHFKHIGMYAFKRKTLLKLSKLPKGRLELLENLEQLRWLEAGFSIGVGLTDIETIGIDSPEDLEKLKLS